MYLTNAEEQVMRLLWKLERAFIRDLMDEFPEPKPAQTTVFTLLKRMIDKGFVNFKQYGNSREYYPLVSKKEYFSKQISEMISKFFNNSTTQFASFFADETDLTRKELEELREIVEKKLAVKRSRK
ncbi:MAG TPA: BlaI/MecI/CopY family transcriptional regulator [Bacteroidales bacterium]|nr:BlaI/MecI/CopY family transcriptional regulator [Bacteroidales bacterium]